MATAEIRHHVSTAGSLTPREAVLHSAPLSMPVRLAPLGNGHGPRGAAVWSAPPPCRITMRRGVVAP